MSQPSQDNARVRRILALDLGTTTGWCRLLADSDLYEYGSWKLSKKSANEMRSYADGNPTEADAGQVRLVSRTTHFQELLDGALDEQVPPDIVVYEEVQFVISLAQITTWVSLLTVLLLTCWSRRIPVVSVPVGTLKKFATGSGNANKKDMIREARQYIESGDLTDDEADAIHLARFGAEQAA